MSGSCLQPSTALCDDSGSVSTKHFASKGSNEKNLWFTLDELASQDAIRTVGF